MWSKIIFLPSLQICILDRLGRQSLHRSCRNGWNQQSSYHHHQDRVAKWDHNWLHKWHALLVWCSSKLHRVCLICQEVVPNNECSEAWNFVYFISFFLDIQTWMVNTDTQFMMVICLTHLPWLCLRTLCTGLIGTHVQWRKATNMTALVVRSWLTPLTGHLTSMYAILTGNLLVS